MSIPHYELGSVSEIEALDWMNQRCRQVCNLLKSVNFKLLILRLTNHPERVIRCVHGRLKSTR